MSGLRRLVVPLAWFAGLGAVLWWALRLPIGPAGAPAVSEPLRLLSWLPTAEPAVVAAGLVRAVVVAVAAWLLLTSALATGAALLRRRSALAAVLRFSPGVVRRLVGSTAAVAITTTFAVTPVGATGTTQRPAVEVSLRSLDAGTALPTATLRLLPPDGPSDAASAVDPATLTLLPTQELRPDSAPPEATAAESAPAEPALDDPPVDDSDPGSARSQPTTEPAARPDTWTVRPGDSFWRIAEELLAADGVQPPDDAFIDYWRRLVDANRAELVDPDNPDLLFPGQVLTAP